ncbi:MAG: carbohydrate-binding family 9-like protein [Tidjanibacter sp.]|nr:carbohydrate-binding family 9-like protein [Tidjanibacter sp.]
MMKQTLTVPKICSADELATIGASGIIGCINWPKEYPYKPTATFRIGHTDTAVCILFSVEEQNVRGVCTESNGSVWEDSCVEFFVRRPDDDHYFNFETNCIGVGLSARRRSRTDDVRKFTAAQADRIVRRSSLPCEPIDKADGRWSLLIEVPFEVIGCNVCPERLYANLYKCGDRTAVPHFVSWSPIDVPTPDFHRPEFFGELIFEK